MIRRFLALALVAFATLPVAADIRVDPLEAVLEDGRVLVTFRLQGAFEREDIVRELKTGLPVVFTYYLDFVRKRANWFDKILDRTQLEAVATFNALTREYLLNFRRDGKLLHSETIRDFDELVERMTYVERRDLFGPPSGPLHRYRVRVRTEVHHDVMFFIIPNTIGTDWKTCYIHAASEVAEPAEPEE